MAGPLAGLRAIDLADESGVFAGRMLAELGADVVRVEPPEGDGIRRRPPFLDDPKHPGVSLYHLHFNAGKRGITLDRGRPEAIQVLRRLADVADIWLTTDGAAAAPPGLDYTSLSAGRPGLVYVSLTPFNPRSPLGGYRANDLVASAMSGLMYLNGFTEDPPLVPGAEQAYHMGSIAAVSAALIAVAGRERDPQRRGRLVEVSLQEATTMATLQTANANIYQWHGRIPARTGMGQQGYGPRNLYLCADGKWISFTIPVGHGPFWGLFLDWLRDEGIEHDLHGPEWQDGGYRGINGARVAAAIEALTGRHPRDHVFHEGQRRRMLTMPVNNVDDLLADGQLRSREYFTRLDHPELGRALDVQGAPYHFSATPAGIARRAPLLGEHNREVYLELLRMSEEELSALQRQGVV